MPSEFNLLGNQYNASRLDQGAEELAAANQLIQSVGNIPPVQQLGNFGPAGMQPQQSPIENLRGFGANLYAQMRASQAPPTLTETTIKRNPETGEGTASVKMSENDLQYFQQASQFYQQALGGYAQEAQRLEMQRQQAESQPWQQLATALSANLAQAKDMPGWVQGLGRTAAQLNPTVDEIRARQMAVGAKQADIAEKGMALGIAEMRTRDERADRAQAKLDRETKATGEAENKLEDNYRLVEEKIQAEVRANKRVTPEQEQALRTVGEQTKRDPKRIESDLARLRANAGASAEALAEQRKFEDEQRRQNAKEAADRLDKTLNAQDRRQAQGQLVTALIPIHKEATFKPADIELLGSINKLEDTFGDFLKAHGAAGGPLAGRAAKLMAAFGNENAQKLLRDQSMALVGLMKAQGATFAGTSEKEMNAIFDSAVRATNNPKVAMDTAVRYQKWFDKNRVRLLQERYAGNFKSVAPVLPTEPLLNDERRPDWRSEFEKHKATLVSDPQSIEAQVVNLPRLMSEIGGKSGLTVPTTTKKVWTKEEIRKLREGQGAGE